MSPEPYTVFTEQCQGKICARLGKNRGNNCGRIVFFLLFLLKILGTQQFIEKIKD